MFAQVAATSPVSGVTNPDLFHVFVRKMVRRIVRGDGGEMDRVGNQTLCTLALVCKKLHKFIQPRIDQRFYTGRPHHPRVVLYDITRMKEYRQRVVEAMRVMMKGLGTNVSVDRIEVRSSPVLQFIIKTGDVYNGRVWVKPVAPSLVLVEMHSVHSQRFRKETEFPVHLTFDTQGWYVVVDDVKGNRIPRLEFLDLLKQRITDVCSRGEGAMLA